MFKIAAIYTLLFNIWNNQDQLRQDGIDVCWETETGRKFYLLLLTDFAITVVSSIFVPLIYFLMNGRKPVVFDIGGNILEVVYRQSIVW